MIKINLGVHMTSDINGTVIAIQGNPVSSTTLGSSQDGYVLTWDNTLGCIVAKPLPASGGLNKAYFTSSGSWTCPVGVTNVLIIAAGGGAGGQGGQGAQGGIGGGGSLQQTSCVAVTSGITYTITIGAGGSGGAGVSSSHGGFGSDGASTTFKNGATLVFSARGAGGTTSSGNNWSGAINTNGNNIGLQAAAGGNTGPLDGNGNYLDMYSGGTNAGWTGACGVGDTTGGSGGGAGPQGNGGNGGSYNISGNGGNGSSCAANSAAGGGGGGGVCNSSGFTGGNGGNGGSGYLYIIY